MSSRGYHILLWTLFIGLLFFSFGQRVLIVEQDGVLSQDIIYDYTLLIAFGADVMLKAIMFYSLEYIHFKELSKKYLCISIVFVSTLALGNVAAYMYELNAEGPGTDLFLDYMFPFSLTFHFIVLVLANAYVANKQKAKLKEQQALLEKESLNTEMEMLRSQINPHFLFNTLNNIYAIARKSKASQVQNSIAKLARLMRYMTYESARQRVSIHQELEYLTDYVELQKMRLTSPENVRFSHNINPGVDFELSPMLLIPFVENAFKHGTASAEISIALDYSESHLRLEVINKVDQVTELNGHGFGLKNSKRRLDLLYPDRHMLKLSDNNGIFHVQLSIDV